MSRTVTLHAPAGLTGQISGGGGLCYTIAADGSVTVDASLVPQLLGIGFTEGSEGSQGPKGDKGDKGDTGTAGTNGANGAAGPTTIGVVGCNFGGSGPFSSSTNLPAGAIVLAVWICVNAPGVPASTIAVGQANGPQKFVAPGIADATTAGVYFYTGNPWPADAAPLQVTSSDGAGCGGTVFVMWAAVSF